MSARRTGLRRVLEIAIAVLALVVVFGGAQGILRSRIGPDDAAVTHGAPYDGPVAAARSRDLPVRVEAVGTVRSASEAGLSARVQGSIEAILVDEGDRVTRGQVIARIAAPELEARRDAARQAVVAAEAALRQAGADRARIEELFGKGAATRVEWEQARTAFSVAEAKLAGSRETARAEEAMAAHAVLKAPFDGLVVARMVDPGALASPGDPIVRIVDDGTFRLESIVDEGRAAALARGTKVRIELDGPSAGIEAAVSEVVPAADPTTRTVIVKVALPATGGQRTGRFGRMIFDAGTRRAIVVPREAVLRVGGLDLIRALDDAGVAVTRYVRIGPETPEGEIEILAGIREGDRVALEPGPDHD